MNAKEFAAQFQPRCMPLGAADTLYQLRDVEIEILAAKPVITVQDVQGLDRGGRFRVANELFPQCEKAARNALIADEHSHVRSAAQLSANHI